MKSLILNSSQNLELVSADRLRNVFVTGLPGSGVHSYVVNLIVQDIKDHQSTIIVDPLGDLAEKILHRVPEQYLSDIAYIDVWNEEYAIGLNIFQAKEEYEKREVANTLISLLYSLYDPHRTGIIGPRFDHAVRNAILTIFFDEKPTFVELLRCLTDNSYVNSLLPRITDPVVKSYWTKQMPQTADFHKSEVLDYIVSKFSAFVTDQRVRNIVCQTDNTFDLEQLVREDKTVIFDFGKYYYDRDANKILGSLLFHSISKVLRTRGDRKDKSVSFYIDEVQRWNSRILADMLMHGSKNNIAVVSVSSRLKQVDKELRYELLRSGTSVCFRSIAADAEVLEKEGSLGKKEKIANLKRGHAVLKTSKNGNVIDPQEIDTTEELLQDSKQNIQEIKNNSQKKYGSPIEKVESELSKKLT